MKAVRQIFVAGVFCIGLMVLSGKIFAQGALQFKENKGQWNEAVLYRSKLPNGYIYLRKTGITYSFLSSEDMQSLRAHFHGTYEGDENKSQDGYFDEGPRHKADAYTSSKRKKEKNKKEYAQIIHAHAYQVNFLKSNPNAKITTNHQAKTHYNYLIGKDKSKWGQNVRGFGGITYEDLYPGINMHIYSNSDGLKYDLIVSPEGDIDEIKFQYEGAEKIYLKNGQLYIQTSVGTNIEVAPYAYQVIDNQKKEIKCKYRLKGNVLSFKAGSSYDPDYPLVIDPSFIFATFSGSSADNWGYTATYDAAGNFYMGGIVFGTGYPSTPGAFQVGFGGGGGSDYGQGGFDISLSKLSPDGKNLIYATYLGGSGNEQPHSLIVNSKNQLIISGRTNSRTYPGKQVNSQSSGWDMILTMLTSDGSNTVGSLIIGGTGDDGVNIADKYTTVNGQYVTSLRRFYGDDARSEVNVDAQDNVLLVGPSQSSNFPVTSGVFQPNIAGDQDAVIIKAAPDLSSITWASYLGGSKNDAAYVLSLAKNGNIYIAGGTESSDFPGVSGNAIQSSYNGRVDGFIAEVTPDGKNLVRATYLGTGQADQIYGIQSDDDGNVYVGGTTEGVWDDVFSDVIHLDGVKYGKQFFCKFNPTLSSLIYTATFGSKNSRASSLPNISPTAFLVDRCQNVYMSGWGGTILSGNYPTQGTIGLPIVNPLNTGGVNVKPDGRDFYFIAMKKNATDILFADTYGQNGGFTDHVDGGTSRFDPNGVIYQAICANCGGGTVFPTGPSGVYSRRNGSLSSPNSDFARCNVVGFKIAFNLDGVRGGIATLDRRDKYCVGEEITFIDTLYGRPAESWTWEVFDQDTVNSIYGPEDTDTSVFKHEFTSTGTFIVRLIKNNPDDCIEHDTSFTKVRIGVNPAKLDATAGKLPPCDKFNYQFKNLSISDNINPIPDKDFIWNFGDGSGDEIQTGAVMQHAFPEEGSYTVKLTLKNTDDFCNTPLDTSFLVNAFNELEARMDVPNLFCEPGKHPLSNVSLGGTNYIWVIEHEGATDSIPVGDMRSVFYDFYEKGKYAITLIAEDTVCKSKDKITDSILVYPKPTADFDAHTNQPQQNPPVNAVFYFDNFSKSNFDLEDTTLSYQWYFGDGVSSTAKNPKHLYSKTGKYDVTLIATNPAGCSDSAYGELEEEIVPALDVPSAFVPGAKGVNGYAAPRAFGVTKMDFRIYNRWGEMVFHSTDPEVGYIAEKGWDGTYKGKKQEMDAYAYVVKVVYEDGSKATKKGSITLIR